MIIPDINLLLSTYDSICRSHVKAVEWWQSCLPESAPVGLLHGFGFSFVRIATNARVFLHPMTAEEAARASDKVSVTRWLVAQSAESAGSRVAQPADHAYPATSRPSRTSTQPTWKSALRPVWLICAAAPAIRTDRYKPPGLV